MIDRRDANNWYHVNRGLRYIVARCPDCMGVRNWFHFCHDEWATKDEIEAGGEFVSDVWIQLPEGSVGPKITCVTPSDKDCTNLSDPTQMRVVKTKAIPQESNT